VTDSALLELWSHWADLEADEERRAEMAIENERAEFRDAAHRWLWRQLHGN
jgi:hypothetical protein